MSEDDPRKPDGEESPAPKEKPTAEAAPAEPDGSAAEADAKAEAAAKAKAKAEAAAKAAAAKAAKEAAEAAKPPWERMPEAPETRDAGGDALVQALQESCPGAIESASESAGDLTLVVARESVREVGAKLKDEHRFHLLVDVCGADAGGAEDAAYFVVYHLFSIEENRRVRLKVKVAEGEEVPSVTPVWRGANWCERETYDMYGIRFAEHPDLTRILLWEGFNGYPLRKDFPVEGIDTGAAIYPEYYETEAGPVAGTGTGWKPPKLPEPEPEPNESAEAAPAEEGPDA